MNQTEWLESLSKEELILEYLEALLVIDKLHRMVNESVTEFISRRLKKRRKRAESNTLKGQLKDIVTRMEDAIESIDPF